MKRLLIASAAAALLVPQAASAANLTGSWKLELQIAGMTYNAACQIAQMDAALSGTCKGSDTDAAVPLTGSVDGSAAKFAYDITYQGNPMHVAYTGQVKSDTAMAGDVDVQIAKGTFTAAKQ